MATMVLACAAIVAGANGALANYAASATGTAATRTARLPAGRRPTATLVTGGGGATGSSVTVTWPPVTLPSGSDVGGYLVERAVATTNSVTQLCTTIVPITGCTDDAPPSGQTVTYTVTPKAQSWSGPASPPSAPIAVP